MSSWNILGLLGRLSKSISCAISGWLRVWFFTVTTQQRHASVSTVSILKLMSSSSIDDRLGGGSLTSLYHGKAAHGLDGLGC